MLKRSCDRCGKVYEADGGYHFAASKNGRAVVREQISVDLCDECYKSLMAWYDVKKTVTHEEVFGTPTTVGTDEER